MPQKLPPFSYFANSRLPLKNYPFIRESGYKRVYVLVGGGGGGGAATSQHITHDNGIVITWNKFAVHDPSGHAQ